MIDYSFSSQKNGFYIAVTELQQHSHFDPIPGLFQSPFFSLFQCTLLDDSSLNPLITLDLIIFKAQ